MVWRFTDVANKASKLLHIVPSMLINEDVRFDILSEKITQYQDEIPKPDLVYLEIKKNTTATVLLENIERVSAHRKFLGLSRLLT